MFVLVIPFIFIILTLLSLKKPSLPKTPSQTSYSNSEYSFSFTYPDQLKLTPDTKPETNYDKLAFLTQNSTRVVSVSAISNIDVYKSAKPSFVASREVSDSGLKYSIQNSTINGYLAAITTTTQNQIITIAHPNKNLFITLTLNSPSPSPAFDQILSTFKFQDITPTPSEKFCGGFAGILCPTGYTCQLDGHYPDAGGKCVKSPAIKCKVDGCNSELCLDASSASVSFICLWKEEYSCLKFSRCEPQKSDTCGWSQTPEYTSCLSEIRQ
jgi:hypothetical protein